MKGTSDGNQLLIFLFWPRDDDPKRLNQPRHRKVNSLVFRMRHGNTARRYIHFLYKMVDAKNLINIKNKHNVNKIYVYDSSIYKVKYFILANFFYANLFLLSFDFQFQIGFLKICERFSFVYLRHLQPYWTEWDHYRTWQFLLLSRKRIHSWCRSFINWKNNIEISK